MEKAYALSVIIPTFNEAENIAVLIGSLQKDDPDELIEIIITDGQSTDDTVMIATRAGARVVVSQIKAGPSK